MPADPKPDDMAFAGLLACTPGEGGPSVGAPGHLVCALRSFDFLDAQPCSEPGTMAAFHREQVQYEYPQSVFELGPLRWGQSFQVAQE